MYYLFQCKLSEFVWYNSWNKEQIFIAVQGNVSNKELSWRLLKAYWFYLLFFLSFFLSLIFLPSWKKRNSSTTYPTSRLDITYSRSRLVISIVSVSHASMTCSNLTIDLAITFFVIFPILSFLPFYLFSSLQDWTYPSIVLYVRWLRPWKNAYLQCVRTRVFKF